MPEQVGLPVLIPADLKLGTYANAFRILRDSGDVFLDFVSYSEQEKCAQVISRVRVHPSFLLAIQARINQVVVELKIQEDAARGKDLSLDKLN